MQLGLQKYLFHEMIGLSNYTTIMKLLSNNDQSVFSNFEFLFTYFTKQFLSENNFIKVSYLIAELGKIIEITICLLSFLKKKMPNSVKLFYNFPMKVSL